VFIKKTQNKENKIERVNQPRSMKRSLRISTRSYEKKSEAHMIVALRESKRWRHISL